MQVISSSQSQGQVAATRLTVPTQKTTSSPAQPLPVLLVQLTNTLANVSSQSVEPSCHQTLA